MNRSHFFASTTWSDPLKYVWKHCIGQRVNDNHHYQVGSSHLKRGRNNEIYILMKITNIIDSVHNWISCFPKNHHGHDGWGTQLESPDHEVVGHRSSRCQRENQEPSQGVCNGNREKRKQWPSILTRGYYNPTQNWLSPSCLISVIKFPYQCPAGFQWAASSFRGVGRGMGPPRIRIPPTPWRCWSRHRCTSEEARWWIHLEKQ